MMLAAAQNDDTKSEEIAKQLVQAALENIQPNNIALEIPDGDNINIAWKEGVKDLAHLRLKEGKKIPLFQEFTNPNVMIEPWSKEGKAWLNNPTSMCKALQARWHHLIGILWPHWMMGQSMAVDKPVGKEPNHIIIFSAFPSSDAAIINVLKLHGIKALELHGKLSPAKHKSVLNEFHQSTQEAGTGVLILSMVGMDMPWSTLEDEQLCSWIY
ncbi:hypothetical protein BKA82DRAFT_4009723 [Pisolithus tinctorius]|nr:hypothetical protein BKA82DRAFT_4009723 [Pisolithus tinctorius]